MLDPAPNLSLKSLAWSTDGNNDGGGGVDDDDDDVDDDDSKGSVTSETMQITTSMAQSV